MLKFLGVKTVPLMVSRAQDVVVRVLLPLMRKYRGEFHWSDDSPEIRKSMRRLLTMIRKQGPLMLSEVESTGAVNG